MVAPERETILARLQSSRQQLERELKRVERKIARAHRQLFAIEQRIVSLTPKQRPAA